jgi:uncharacterized membrane protein
MGNLQKTLNTFLRFDIDFLELFVYIIASLIIFLSILNSIYLYFYDYNKNSELGVLEAKIKLSNTISLALSFILSIEILKIYYIKTYKQLIIVSSLVIIKLIVNYFLNKEIEDAMRKKLNIHKINHS